MNLATIPGTLITSLEAASDPSDPGSPKILEMNEKAINRIADLCVKESTKVAESFQAVMDVRYLLLRYGNSQLIDELMQVATATQGFSEEEARALEKKRLEVQKQKEKLEEEEKL